MTRRPGKSAFIAALLGLGAAGCSLPGMQFHGSPTPTAGTAAKGGRYAVQRITPALLTRQAVKRDKRTSPQANPGLKEAISNYVYRVQPQDVLRIIVWGHPEFSPGGSALQALSASSRQTSGNGVATKSQAAAQAPGRAGFTVKSDGSIYFPYVGLVHVAGLTTGAIRSKLIKALSGYLVKPQVNVSVAGFHSQTYQLSGSVKEPGLYPITNVPRTVSQAIQAAGGILQTVPNVTVASKAAAQPLADLAHVLYIHNSERRVLNMRAFFLHGDEAQDRLLRPGDIIQVPDNAFDQVHLIGEVKNVGNYPLDHGRLNLAQALSSAGGLNLRTANPAKIFVFRGAYQNPHIFWLDARSPQAMLLATQFQLSPQDVVYVATAGVSTWNRIVTQILPTVEALNQTKRLLP